MVNVYQQEMLLYAVRKCSEYDLTCYARVNSSLYTILEYGQSSLRVVLESKT